MSGLTACKLTNTMVAPRIAIEKDRQSRDRIGDDSTDVMGIVRSISLFPDFRMYLWTKQSAQLYHQLAKSDKLILNIDATGSLLNFTAVEDLKDKILHTKVTVSPKYVIVDAKHMRDKTVSRMMSPLTLAEMASNKNTAKDYREFYENFLASVEEVHPGEAKLRPLLCLTDCSPQLESGALLAFPVGDGVELTRIEYGNRILLHLLHFDKALLGFSRGEVSAESRKEVAAHVLISLRKHIGVFLKECKSHVCRAPITWLKRNKSSEFTHSRDRIDAILSKTFSSLLDELQVSELIVRLLLLVALFETRKFDSPSFHDGMEAKDHRGPSELETEKRLLKAVDDFIRHETARLRIDSLKEVTNRLGEVSAIKSWHILFHDGIIDRAKDLMKQQGCTYLKSVSVSNDNSWQKMAVLRCSILYGRALEYGSGNEAMLLPEYQGGIDMTVLLPHDGRHGIVNPLYSPTVAKYLRSTWLTKVPLFSRGIIYLLEIAKDMDIEDSNQFSEAVFKNVKHNQDVYNHVSDPGEYLLHRWEDDQRTSRQFIQQFECIKSQLEQLDSRRSKKRRCEESAGLPADEVAPAAAREMTHDELTQQEEEEEEEVWS